MIKLKELSIMESINQLKALPQGKLLINTINAHSYNTALKDPLFANALIKGDALIPDGASIVKVCKWLKMQSQPRERIAGWDLFVFEMNRLNEKGGRCMFMGSSENVLAFSQEDNVAIVAAINEANPDLLWIGMTAPKQEKWIYSNWQKLNIHCHVGTVGAVFDFYAGTTERAPLWWQQHSLEWLYRLIKEPKRMWRRYLIGNVLFLWNICKEI